MIREGSSHMQIVINVVHAVYLLGLATARAIPVHDVIPCRVMNFIMIQTCYDSDHVLIAPPLSFTNAKTT